MGRVRTVKWGPRTIDLDILEFDGQVMDSETLVLPHPLYTQRSFVLKPLIDLEPDWVPSGENETVTAFLEKLDTPMPERVEGKLCPQS